jgi:ribosomal protein S18 acetylase RimI-like enzyme
LDSRIKEGVYLQTVNKPIIGIAETEDLFKIAELKDTYIVDLKQHFLRLVLFPANFFCGLVVVAKDNKGQIVGYSYALRALDPDQWYLGYIYVEENARHNQVAKKMLLMIEEEVRRRRGKKVFATVSPSNLFSMKLFLNGLGWRGYEFKRNYYGEGEHRIIVSKNLLEDSIVKQQIIKSATFIKNSDHAKLTRLLKANYRIIGAFKRDESVFLALINQEKS